MKLMENPSRSITCLAIILVLQGCLSTRDASYYGIPVTSELRSKYRLTDSELRQLQYYILHEVELTLVETGATNISKDLSTGVATSSRTDVKRVITILPGTPGLATNISEKEIDIDFGGGVVLPLTEVYGDYHYFGEDIVINGARYKATIYKYRDPDDALTKIVGQISKREVADVQMASVYCDFNTSARVEKKEVREVAPGRGKRKE